MFYPLIQNLNAIRILPEIDGGMRTTICMITVMVVSIKSRYHCSRNDIFVSFNQRSTSPRNRIRHICCSLSKGDTLAISYGFSNISAGCYCYISHLSVSIQFLEMIFLFDEMKLVVVCNSNQLGILLGFLGL